MKKPDLIGKLREHGKDNCEVLIHIEGECYYPIVNVKLDDGKVILVCKDIKKVEVENK